MGPRKVFSKEFKLEAVKLVSERGDTGRYARQHHQPPTATVPKKVRILHCSLVERDNTANGFARVHQIERLIDLR